MSENFSHFSYTPMSPMEIAAFDAVRRLQENGHRAFFVGGCVRDMLMGRPAHDIDVTTSALPDQVSALFEKNIPVGATFGIITAIINDNPIEIATFRAERGYSDGRHPDQVEYTDDPQLDVTRRDFTVNGLLFDPVSGRLLDYVDGIEDIRHGLLRAIGEPAQRFAEDKLRMLRAVRFAAKLGFELDAATAQQITAFAPQIHAVSQERIHNELEGILTGPDPERGFRMLSSLGLLKEILPEIETLHDMPHNPVFHPEGDVFEHTMHLLRHAKWRTPEIMWSALLHDIGKGVTLTWDGSIPHYYGHEAAGAPMAEDVMRRLRSSNDLIQTVTNAVRNHMRYASFTEMKKPKWKRILLEPKFYVDLELHRLDCISSHGMLDNYLCMLDRIEELKNEPIPIKPFLNGNDLIACGYTPGPLFKQILEKSLDLQFQGTITTRDEAIEWLKTFSLESSSDQ